MHPLINRLKPFLRRARGTRGLRAAATLAARPYLPTARGVDMVVGEYYGMLVGRTFASQEEAARHYFSTGWKLGVIPNPLIDLPAVRFSIFASLRLRNALAQAAMIGECSTALPLSRLADALALAARYPRLPDRRGGWPVALMRLSHLERERLPMLIGARRLAWRDVMSECSGLAEVAAAVHRGGLLDLDFYSLQIGGARPLTPEAALDDYLTNGEFDGRSPHPFFEAEWHLERDRAQRRTGRALNQFLEYVRQGQRGQASPHFWGQRCLEIHPEADETRLIAWFAERAGRQEFTPSSEGVTPVKVSDALEITRRTVGEYHASLAVIRPAGAIVSRHIVSPGSATPSGTFAIVVDGRHLTLDSVPELAEAAAQRDVEVRLLVIEETRYPRSSGMETEFARIGATVTLREGHESFGSAARRALQAVSPTAWTMWRPGELWDPRFAFVASSVLAAHPEASAAVVAHDGLSQSWLNTADALWLDDVDGAGVVLRGTGPDAVLPDAALDLGVAQRIVFGLAEDGVCAVIRSALVEVISDRAQRFEARAGANAARSRRLVRFDQPIRDGVVVSIPTYEDWALTAGAVRAVLAHTPGEDVRIVVVDNGSRRPVATLLAGEFAGDARVKIRRLPRNTDFALGSNAGVASEPARTLVFLNNDTIVQAGWLEPLLASLDAGAVAAQPLLLYPDRTVQTAGTVFPGGLSMPCHLLAGFHQLDVDPRISEYPFAALTAACVAMRFEDWAAAGGFDTHYVNGMEDVDLSLKLRQRTGRPLRVCTSSRVLHLESKTPNRHAFVNDNRHRFVARWHHELVHDLDDRNVLDGTALSWTSMRWRPQRESPLREGEIVLTRHLPLQVDEAAPRLRWAIKTSATGDSAGDTWGDTFFADDLADALRRCGQDVVVDRISSHTRPQSDVWDDVTLTLRGLTSFTPQPDAVNLLWVISHPDLVTRAELVSGFDAVYAAGDIWARRMSEAWQVRIQTLLQATNERRFTPAAGSGRSDSVVFVGRTRGVPRKIVADAIAVGGDVAVYGDDGWEQFIHPRYIRGSLVANDELPTVYAEAGVVLNDHWDDMAAEGFLSNRLFDAAAAGARIVSDPVAGMEEVFGPQVAVYRTREELAQLLSEPGRWPSDSELRLSAASVARDHSFTARAQRLVEDALRIRRERAAD
ncbi:glycosyltransferase [Microbacterium sp. zg-Y818]|uniref:glycosyltransferase family protein n=1 Tax=unclassified Microbacterium TaxID=2609290 RepID=UPI00214C7BC5|nr:MULTISPECIES: glycosyltransferase [unclassified Microbacterium]MCR2801708.1 glycosyltransferase [Microbacterium sp. zg.Y818]WIM23025.1 glycosyltransferase [Microbacterium sp. zg-Y818]